MAHLSPAQLRRLDLNAEDLGVPVVRLMANAGKALAKAVRPHAKPGHPVFLLCGKGNNGGDGFAAAADLQAAGIDAHVILLEPAMRIATPAARHHFARLPAAQIARWRTPTPRAWSASTVLVDCMLGAGLHGPPRAPYASAIRWLNQRRRAGAVVIACDVPTGLGTRLAVRPSQTVTLHARKPGMTALNSGRIHIARIGIPPAAETGIGLGDLDLAYHRPGATSHKGNNGRVLVIAGSVPLAGAAHYVALGALRTGADLVHITIAANAAAAVRAWGPESIVHAVNDGDHLTSAGVPDIVARMRSSDAVVMGSGLGSNAPTRQAVRSILEQAVALDKPVVVDADALDALDDDVLCRHGKRMILTPHAQEFHDLTGRAATRGNVVAYARKYGVTVLRKSAVDVVSDGARTLTCNRGHPTLTVGGTGDVLAGIAGALLAKGAAPFEAACAASYLLKSAGEVAAAVRSYGATATDVAEAIPAILLRLP